MIFALGLPAIVLTLLGPPWAPWGPVVGLVAQPFWLVSTWRARQWGMFGASIGWTAAWAWGLWLHWSK